MRDIFATSDWHVDHARVLEFSNRPFKDIIHMRESLINNYNATVNPGALCYFLGDVIINDRTSDVIRRLNGDKILILGNHDKKTVGFYRRLGFTAVLYSAVIYVGQYRVSMSHCPLRGLWREDTRGMRGSAVNENWHGESRLSNRRFSVVDDCDAHLHGHIHSPNSGKSKRTEGKQFDVGVDANNYRPVCISKQILSWLDRLYGTHTDNKER